MMKTTLVLATFITVGLTCVSTHAETDQAKLIKQGEYLSRLGDCMACHTAVGKESYAGGLPIRSPLGTIYSTNITPDKQYGIGNFTEQQFAAAVRQGVLPDGRNLYPAMPYPNYAKITDQDIHALYTYFMYGVKPSQQHPPATQLAFPFNQRWGISLWNWVFTDKEPFTPIKDASAQINRGAYLVESLGHCGSCHSPRGWAMNEKSFIGTDESFVAGGELNGWAVPSLRGIARWSNQDIVDYLATGRNSQAGVAGEMTSVVAHSTSYMSDTDLNAIASYIKALGGNPPLPVEQEKAVSETAEHLTAAKNLTSGERLYLDNCNACHFVEGKGAPGAFPQLDQASIVNADNPTGLIHVILVGAQLPSTEKSASALKMPGFGHRLNDQQVAELATFIRQGWSNKAGAVSAEQVKKVRATLETAH